MSFDFSSIEHFYSFFVGLLSLFVETDFEIALIFEFGDFLELFLYIFDQFDSLFVFRVGILDQPTMMYNLASFKIFAIELKQTLLGIWMRIFNDNEWSDCFVEKRA